jgi:sugar phosphate isomerase/epimerase
MRRFGPVLSPRGIDWRGTLSGIGISGGDLDHLSVSQIICKADEFDVDDIELKWIRNVSGFTEVEDLKPVLDAAHKTVNVLNTFLFRSLGEQERACDTQAVFGECLRAARLLGSRFMLVYCGCDPADRVSAAESERQVRQYLDAMASCARACAIEGITLVVENHPNMLLRTLEATLHLLREAEPLGLRLAFDPSNFYNSGVEPYPLVYRRVRQYVAVLHVKDSVMYQGEIYGPGVKLLNYVLEGGRAIDAICVPLGKGGMNWEGLCEELLRDGFGGPLIVEPHTALKDLDEAFAANIRYLRAKGLGLRSQSATSERR